MRYVIDIYGVLVPSLLLWIIVAYVLSAILRRLMQRFDLYRLVWHRALFDFSIFVDVPRNELERRLMERWHGHGRSDEEARAWIASNDMPNIERVLARRRAADLVIG